MNKLNMGYNIYQTLPGFELKLFYHECMQTPLCHSDNINFLRYKSSLLFDTPQVFDFLKVDSGSLYYT